MKLHHRFYPGFEFYQLLHRCALALFLSALAALPAYYGLVLKPRHEAQLLMYRQARQWPLVDHQVQQERLQLERMKVQIDQSSSLLKAFELPSAAKALRRFHNRLLTSAARHEVAVVSLRQNAAERFTPPFAMPDESEAWQRILMDLSLSASWSDYSAFIRDLSNWHLWMEVITQNAQTHPNGYLSIDLSLRLYTQALRSDHHV